jgi:hypothetical protein
MMFTFAVFVFTYERRGGKEVIVILATIDLLKIMNGSAVVRRGRAIISAAGLCFVSTKFLRGGAGSRKRRSRTVVSITATTTAVTIMALICGKHRRVVLVIITTVIRLLLLVTFLLWW